MISSVTEAVCRAKANELLASFLVESPEEIDLETLAWQVGHLSIEVGELDTADGRLVATNSGGVIRIGTHVAPEGRRRFTIAHEIGHFCLHGPGVVVDSNKELSRWENGSLEAQANIFAGELLMPQRLFKPRVIQKSPPCLAAIDSLAQEFQVSSLATAVHYVMHTPEPCALVVSRNGKIEWFRLSKGFEFHLRLGKLHPFSAAGEILAGKTTPTQGMAIAPAGAWITEFDANCRENIKEDSRLVSEYGMIVTLLWVEDDWDI